MTSGVTALRVKVIRMTAGDVVVQVQYIYCI